MRTGKGIFKLAAVAGAVAALYGGASFAQVPVEVATFDQWTANNGTISYNCPAGWTCSTIASGNGFLQVSMQQAGAQDAYIRTIVTDQNATVDPTLVNPSFADETVVLMTVNLGGGGAANPQGILGKQTINQTTPDGTQFTANTSIATGWGLGAGGFADAISIDQQLVNQGGAGYADDFVSNFFYDADADNNGDGLPDGFNMQLDQVVGLKQAGVGSDTDLQVFTLRQIQGTKQAATGTASLPTGQSLNYNPGDNIKATWIGQTIDLTAQPGGTGGGTGGGMTGGMMGSMFGYQAYEVVGSPQTPNPITYFSLFNTGPWNWDPNFGPTPCMVDTTGNPNPAGVDSNTGLPVDAAGNPICP